MRYERLSIKKKYERLSIKKKYKFSLFLLFFIRQAFWDEQQDQWCSQECGMGYSTRGHHLWRQTIQMVEVVFMKMML